MSCSSHKFEVGDNVIINIYRQNHNEILDKYGIDYKMLCNGKDTSRTMYHHRSGKIISLLSICNSTGECVVYKLDTVTDACFLPDELTLVGKLTVLEPCKGSDPVTQCNVPISSTGIYIPSMPDSVIGIPKGRSNTDTEDGLMMCIWRPVVPIQVEAPSESIDSAVSLMNTYRIIIDGVYVNA